jgi:hypothetical protein
VIILEQKGLYLCLTWCCFGCTLNVGTKFAMSFIFLKFILDRCDLRITDSLGCSVTDDIFEVYVTPSSTNHADLKNLKIFPNPASNIVTIEFDKQIEKVNLFDMNAKLIKEVNENHIDLSDMINGIYVIQIKLLSGELINSKIYKRDTP